MLQQEFSVILEQLDIISRSLEIIFSQLDDLLSRTDKNITVQFGEELFEFYPPSTPEEMEDMKVKRHRLIKLLLIDAKQSYINHMPIALNSGDLTDFFESLLVFTYGPDPKDLQFEKVALKDLYEVVDENGNAIKSLPLNLQSHYVKAELEDNHAA